MLEGCVPWPPELAARYRQKGYWEDLTLREMLDESVRRYRDKPALVFHDRRLSYAELAQDVDRLVLRLREAGLRPSQRVVLHLPNIPELVTTFFALVTQDEQLRCFANVARRLEPGGCFAMEGFVPDVARFDRGQRVHVMSMDVDRVRLDVSRHHPVDQRVDAQHVVLSPTGVRLVPVVLRYAWPSELDLMARLAGLQLRDRWGGWNREPFDDDSAKHVSVYEKPASS